MAQDQEISALLQGMQAKLERIQSGLRACKQDPTALGELKQQIASLEHDTSAKIQQLRTKYESHVPAALPPMAAPAPQANRSSAYVPQTQNAPMVPPGCTRWQTADGQWHGDQQPFNSWAAGFIHSNIYAAGQQEGDVYIPPFSLKDWIRPGAVGIDGAYYAMGPQMPWTKSPSNSMSWSYFTIPKDGNIVDHPAHLGASWRLAARVTGPRYLRACTEDNQCVKSPDDSCNTSGKCMVPNVHSGWIIPWIDGMPKTKENCLNMCAQKEFCVLDDDGSVQNPENCCDAVQFHCETCLAGTRVIPTPEHVGEHTYDLAEPSWAMPISTMAFAGSRTPSRTTAIMVKAPAEGQGTFPPFTAVAWKNTQYRPNPDMGQGINGIYKLEGDQTRILQDVEAFPGEAVNFWGTGPRGFPMYKLCLNRGSSGVTAAACTGTAGQEPWRGNVIYVEPWVYPGSNPRWDFINVPREKWEWYISIYEYANTRSEPYDLFLSNAPKFCVGRGAYDSRQGVCSHMETYYGYRLLATLSPNYCYNYNCAAHDPPGEVCCTVPQPHNA